MAKKRFSVEQEPLLLPIQKNRLIVAPRDDVKDLSLIVEF